ncbi:hypothetical protein AB0C81_14025 [Streptomyces roseoverticillatus]|uniref:hypothetical protein n=1 Tax=Streptomyces roseoverticillatus TaxID=66429 RepID=UPI0033FFAAFE
MVVLALVAAVLLWPATGARRLRRLYPARTQALRQRGTPARLSRCLEWFALLAPKADRVKEKAARGAVVHDFRLWSRIYPAAGREGYVPLAFVFTGKTAAQRESRMRRLEQALRACLRHEVRHCTATCQ